MEAEWWIWNGGKGKGVGSGQRVDGRGDGCLSLFIAVAFNPIFTIDAVHSPLGLSMS